MATTYTPNYHLGKQEDRSDKFLMQVITKNMDIIDEQLKSTDDKATAAAAGLKYKGAVNYYNDLPNDAEIGDAYTVLYAGSSGTVPDGTEYVWGELNGTAQWIDFSKDSYTKAEVDALLAAKQALINANNKLDPAYINYDSTHRAVSDTEKSTWNDKQNAIDSSHKLSADLVDDTSTTNKFATAAELEQIATNEANILTVADQTTQYNHVPVKTETKTLGAVTFVANATTGVVNVNGDNTSGSYKDYELPVITLAAGTYKMLSYSGVSASTIVGFILRSGGTTIATEWGDSGVFTLESSTVITPVIRAWNGANISNVNMKPFVILKSLYDAGFTDFQPYSLPNTKITPELIELVDSGAKNLSPVSTGTSSVASYIVESAANLPAGDYVFCWKNSVTSNVSTVINCYKSDNTRVVNENEANSAVETRFITIPQDCVKFNLYTTGANQVTDLMICTKAAWDVSQKYAPYAPSNAELYAMIKALQA